MMNHEILEPGSIEVRHAYGMSQGNLHLKAVLSWQKFRGRGT